MILILSQSVLAQTVNRYEAEMVKNPNKGGKDTRQVNAVLIFEKDTLIINSRRRNEAFKQFKYSDIKYIEHSFSKTPLSTIATRSIILSLFTGGLPLFYKPEEKHWLTILTENEFVVLKIENDNFRLLRMEFLVRDFDIVNVNEDR